MSRRTRMQRNRKRKIRRRYVAFSLLACLSLFVTGVYITNNVMMEITGMPEDDSIFSFINMGQALKDAASDIKTINVGNMLAGAGQSVARLYYRIIKIIRELLS